jgi:hypothetical protein
LFYHAGSATKSLQWIISPPDKLKTKVPCIQDTAYTILFLFCYAKIPKNLIFYFFCCYFPSIISFNYLLIKSLYSKQWKNKNVHCSLHWDLLMYRKINLVEQPCQDHVNEINMVVCHHRIWSILEIEPGDAPYGEVLEPFSTKGQSSWTTFCTGFSSAHTAASKYPSSKSRSRTWSSAGSNAHLKSWSGW